MKTREKSGTISWKSEHIVSLWFTQTHQFPLVFAPSHPRALTLPGFNIEICLDTRAYPFYPIPQSILAHQFRAPIASFPTTVNPTDIENFIHSTPSLHHLQAYYIHSNQVSLIFPTGQVPQLPDLDHIFSTFRLRFNIAAPLPQATDADYPQACIRMFRDNIVMPDVPAHLSYYFPYITHPTTTPPPPSTASSISSSSSYNPYSTTTRRPTTSSIRAPTPTQSTQPPQSRRQHTDDSSNQLSILTASIATLTDVVAQIGTSLTTNSQRIQRLEEQQSQLTQQTPTQTLMNLPIQDVLQVVTPHLAAAVSDYLRRQPQGPSPTYPYAPPLPYYNPPAATSSAHFGMQQAVQHQPTYSTPSLHQFPYPPYYPQANPTASAPGYSFTAGQPPLPSSASTTPAPSLASTTVPTTTERTSLAPSSGPASGHLDDLPARTRNNG
jgi:hypothetical protein